jgi:hypothetical protein
MAGIFLLDDVDEVPIDMVSDVGGVKASHMPICFRGGPANYPRLSAAVDVFCFMMVMFASIYGKLPLEGLDCNSTSPEITSSISDFFRDPSFSTIEYGMELFTHFF